MGGFFYVHLHLCMYGLIHRVTGQRILKGLVLLPNAPWMMGLGERCDKSHPHTPLEGVHVPESKVYPWGFCRAYARLLKSACIFLATLHRELPVHNQQDFRKIRRIAFDGMWPDIPLTVVTGDLDIERRMYVMEHPLEDESVETLLAGDMIASVVVTTLEQESSVVVSTPGAGRSAAVAAPDGSSCAAVVTPPCTYYVSMMEADDAGDGSATA